MASRYILYDIPHFQNIGLIYATYRSHLTFRRNTAHLYT